MKTIYIFFCLWRHNDPQYGYIDAGLAWELAKIFAEFDEELSQWEVLE